MTTTADILKEYSNNNGNSVTNKVDIPKENIVKNTSGGTTVSDILKEYSNNKNVVTPTENTNIPPPVVTEKPPASNLSQGLSATKTPSLNTIPTNIDPMTGKTTNRPKEKKIVDIDTGKETNIVTKPQQDIFASLVQGQKKILDTAGNIVNKGVDIAKKVPAKLIDYGKKSIEANKVNPLIEIPKALGRGIGQGIGGFGGVLDAIGNSKATKPSLLENRVLDILNKKKELAIKDGRLNDALNLNNNIQEQKKTINNNMAKANQIKNVVKQVGGNFNEVEKYLNKIFEQDKELAKIRDTNIFQAMLYGGIESAPTFLGGIGLTILTKKPNLGLAMLSTTAGGSTYKQAMANGNTHETAVKAGINSFISNFLTERLSLEYITKTGLGGQIAKNITNKISPNWVMKQLGHLGMSGLFEGSEEGVQYFADLIDAKYKTFLTSGYDPKRKFSERDLLVAMGAGGISGIGGGILAGGAPKTDQTNIQQPSVDLQQGLAPANKNIPVQPKNTIVEPPVAPIQQQVVAPVVEQQKTVLETPKVTPKLENDVTLPKEQNKLEKYTELQNSGLLSDFDNKVVDGIKQAIELNLPETVTKLESLLDTKKIDALMETQKLIKEVSNNGSKENGINGGINGGIDTGTTTGGSQPIIGQGTVGVEPKVGGSVQEQGKVDNNQIKGGENIVKETVQKTKGQSSVSNAPKKGTNGQGNENVKGKNGNVLTADELLSKKGELSPISYLKKRGLRIALDDVVRSKGLDNKQFRFVTSTNKNADNVIGYDDLSDVFQEYYPSLTNDEILDKIIKNEKLYTDSKLDGLNIDKGAISFEKSKPDLENKIKLDISKTNDPALKSLLNSQLKTLDNQTIQDYNDLEQTISEYKKTKKGYQTKQETNDDSLIKEARKYKNVEEFVKTQKTFYHGTPKKFNNFNTNISEGNATWFTADKKDILDNTAGAVQPAGSKLNIMERYQKPDLKLATPKQEDNMFTDQLISEGYRGVKYPKGEYGDYEWTKLFFPNEDTITKSQLTEIWNKSNKQEVIKRGMDEMKRNATRDTQIAEEKNIPSENNIHTGVKELIDYYKSKDISGRQIYEVYNNKQTLQSEIEQGLVTKEYAQQVLKDSGMPNLDLSLARVFGSNETIIQDNIEKDVIKLYGGSNITTVIEERAESVYRSIAKQDNNFENNITKWRKDYEVNNNQYSDKSDIEWFSDLAIDYAIHNKINMKINLGLRQIFQALKRYLKILLKRASVLRLAIKNGKINQELVNSLDKAVFRDIETKTSTPQTETKAFKDWFGDSKVVDKDGKPLVVYHGTNSDFDIFKRAENTIEYLGEGIYFTDKKDVSLQYGKNTKETYLSIKYPKYFDAEGKSFNQIAKEIKPLLRSLGGFDNDGIIITNIYDSPEGKRKGKKSTVYIVDGPTQIKSAIGNKGTFDPNNPNINYQIDEMSKEQLLQEAMKEIEQEKIRIKSINSPIKNNVEELNKQIEPINKKVRASRAFSRLVAGMDLTISEIQAKNPLYNVSDFNANRIIATKIVEDNLELALDMAKNNIAPKGIEANIFESAIKKELTKQGRQDEAMSMADSITMRGTMSGKEIASLKEIYANDLGQKYYNDFVELKTQNKMKMDYKTYQKKVVNEAKKLEKKVKQQLKKEVNFNDVLLSILC